MSRRTEAIVIGAGHAGLAMSRCLSEQSIEHLVLERGEVANSWRTERWDSLRLLTPNWQSRLPGYGYEGDDPDGYRTMAETVAFIERYADVISSPVEQHSRVTSVRDAGGDYEVTTERSTWRARAVVLASGACNVASVPAVADRLPPSVMSVTPMEYRNPGQLPRGGVLVVGASASGVQIADEVHRSGRPVTLSAGEFVRVPRTYRGRDVQWWMDACGVLDERYDEMENLDRARSLPSLQLAGSDEGRMLDLNALTDVGVKLVGRLVGVNGRTAQFSGSLANMCAMADLKLNRLLDRNDEWASRTGADIGLPSPHRFEPTRVESSPPLLHDLERAGISTVIWATGFRPDHSWVHLPVFDHRGRIRHDGGIVAPGLYVIGLPFLRRRRSSLIDGAGDDARDLSLDLANHVRGVGSGAARTRRAMAEPAGWY
jgi:putative flavoprotein involved in K+ transport